MRGRTSNRGVPACLRRRLPARFAAAALLALVVQLGLSVLAPIADAHEPRNLPVHVERPGRHHMAHNPEMCAFCIAIQAGGVPAHVQRAPLPRVVQRAVSPPQVPASHTNTRFSVSAARAPPSSA